MINHCTHCSNHTNLMMMMIVRFFMLMVMIIMKMMMMMMMVYFIYSYIFRKSLGEQLYDAAKSGDVEAVERLLVEGANIEYIGLVREVIIVYLLIYLVSA